MKVCNAFGADAVRLYLMNSQLVKGQSLNFKESGVSAIIKDVFLPLYNSYKFLIQNIQNCSKNICAKSLLNFRAEFLN